MRADIRADLRRQTRQLLALVSISALSGCSPPPPQLSAPQEELVGRCLELAYKQETAPECSSVTESMSKAFVAKHPDFYQQLLAARKQFVEDQIAKDIRRRDELNLCLNDREAGNTATTSCKDFMPHEIARGLEDRRRRLCASASLDGEADAAQRCEGLSQPDIDEEVRLERGRRERRQ